MSYFCWEIFLLQIHFLTFKNVVFHRQIPQNRQDEPSDEGWKWEKVWSTWLIQQI